MNDKLSPPVSVQRTGGSSLPLHQQRTLSELVTYVTKGTENFKENKIDFPPKRNSHIHKPINNHGVTFYKFALNLRLCIQMFPFSHLSQKYAVLNRNIVCDRKLKLHESSSSFVPQVFKYRSTKRNWVYNTKPCDKESNHPGHDAVPTGKYTHLSLLAGSY
jgi:hypothetical protein